MLIISTWADKSSRGETDELLHELVLLHAAEISCGATRERIRQCLGNTGAGDHRYLDLCNLQLEPEYLSPLNVLHLAQIKGFYKKRRDLELGFDRQAKALAKFEESERMCEETNRRFTMWKRGRYQFAPAVEAALHAAQRKISHVLGECPSLEQLRIRFGPGSTTQVKKKNACAKVKLSQMPACSEEAVSSVASLLEEIPGYTFDRVNGDFAVMDVNIHPGKVAFVLKNALEDRTVVTEPWLNMMFQLGYGDYIARRLRRIGIDIRDQTRNQRMAREGSITGELATLDLTSASDLNAVLLVEHLLPGDWYDSLCSVRTGRVTVKGVEGNRCLSKFSSMGNGYTFPLETLLFWAITSAVCEDDPRVTAYGDDIICPAHKAEEVMFVLRELGHKPNPDKSYWRGPFRESCGTDWFSGIDVRPAFITDTMTGHAAFRLHNYYVRSGMPEFAACVARHIPEHVRLFGPDGFGDGHLLGSWNPKFKRSHLARGYGGALFDTWCYSKRTFDGRLPGDRILPVYTQYLREQEPDLAVDRSLLEDRRFLSWLHHQGDERYAPVFYEGQGQRFTRGGVPVNFLPGTEGCKRITIYTFER